MAMYSAVHGPDAAQLEEPSPRVVAVGPGIEHEPSVGERASERQHGLAPARRHAQQRRSGVGDRFGRRERALQRALRVGDGSAQRRRQPPRQRAGRLQGHLLPQDGADGELGAVHRTGHAATRRAAHQRSEQTDRAPGPRRRPPGRRRGRTALGSAPRRPRDRAGRPAAAGTPRGPRAASAPRCPTACGSRSVRRSVPSRDLLDAGHRALGEEVEQPLRSAGAPGTGAAGRRRRAAGGRLRRRAAARRGGAARWASARRSRAPCR